MKIRTRLRLTAFIPSIVLLSIAVFFLYDTYVKFEKIQLFKTALTNSIEINKVLREVGKERGLSVIYLTTGGSDYQEKLAKQRLKTDRSIIELRERLVFNQKKLLDISDLTGKKIDLNGAAYRKMMHNFSQLSLLRKNIDSKEEGFKKTIIGGYANLIGKELLRNLMQSVNYAYNARSKEVAGMLGQLYASEEYTALMRDFMIYYIVKKIPLEDENLTQLNNFYVKSFQFDPATAVWHFSSAVLPAFLKKTDIGISYCEYTMFNFRN